MLDRLSPQDLWELADRLVRIADEMPRHDSTHCPHEHVQARPGPLKCGLCELVEELDAWRDYDPHADPHREAFRIAVYQLYGQSYSMCRYLQLLHSSEIRAAEEDYCVRRAGSEER